ncbi:BREX-1 system adenine-specific DNA-methyltransferase PglX [Aeromonas veronii]|uniref:BREX-1 system adenine-specific DNA-methyltransferase PglX n=1 Tax=Aeromonas veronii TaxID=654 RepID=UPI003007DDCE
MSQQQNNDMQQHFYRASAADFGKIPGSPIGYWVSDSIRNLFPNSKALVNSIANPNQALVTGNTEAYIRKWYEPSLASIGFGLNREEAKSSCKKWFPYNKGGEYRNWIGNFEHVVDWENDGYKLQTTMHPSGNRVWAHNFVLDSIFEEALVWSKITSGKPCFRYSPKGFLFDDASGVCSFEQGKGELLLGLFCSKVNLYIQKIINPTLNIQPANIRAIPLPPKGVPGINEVVSKLIYLSKIDWDSFEVSWGFNSTPFVHHDHHKSSLEASYKKLRLHWNEVTQDMQRLEEENNRIFIEAYGLQDELTPDVSLSEITLTCNPYYRYGGNLTDEEREARLQSDTIAELISYAIGCMMGRYSLDREGLVYAHAGNEGFKALVEEGAYATFAADEDGILPLSTDSWFEDDVATRLEAFVCTVWGKETLEENLQFIADSLCLAAIKPVKKGGETSRETIRRYLSTQFYKDHMKTYKKRPIYWLFSSGKEKAFECLVYLHRYNEATLPRMRTEYVTPLLGQMAGRIERLRLQQTEASTSDAKRIGKEIDSLTKQLSELRAFDDQLKHHADMRITLDLDDGVKVNYGKFGTLLSDVKAITGDKGE